MYPTSQLCVATVPSSLGMVSRLYLILPLVRMRLGQVAVCEVLVIFYSTYHLHFFIYGITTHGIHQTVVPVQLGDDPFQIPPIPLS